MCNMGKWPGKYICMISTKRNVLFNVWCFPVFFSVPEKPICSSPYGDNGSIVLLWDSPKDTLIKLDEYVIQISTDEWNTFKEISKHSQTGVLKHEIQNAIEGLIYRFNIYSCSNSVRSQAQTLQPFPARRKII